MFLAGLNGKIFPRHPHSRQTKGFSLISLSTRSKALRERLRRRVAMELQPGQRFRSMLRRMKSLVFI